MAGSRAPGPEPWWWPPCGRVDGELQAGLARRRVTAPMRPAWCHGAELHGDAMAPPSGATAAVPAWCRGGRTADDHERELAAMARLLLSQALLPPPPAPPPEQRMNPWTGVVETATGASPHGIPPPVMDPPRRRQWQRQHSCAPQGSTGATSLSEGFSMTTSYGEESQLSNKSAIEASRPLMSAMAYGEDGERCHWPKQDDEMRLVAVTGRQFLPNSEKVSAMCWAIWKARNKACFRGKLTPDPSGIIYHTCVFLRSELLQGLTRKTFRGGKGCSRQQLKHCSRVQSKTQSYLKIQQPEEQVTEYGGRFQQEP
ncbi:hypothetical protein ACP70R_028355 [Stipagrostis hirtigluma subsp. patula]